MSQIFPRSANTIARLTLIGLALAIPLFVGLWALYLQSSTNTGVGTVVEQPIAFSHVIHAGRLGLDCRYCHTSVETSPFAGNALDPAVYDLPFADRARACPILKRWPPA